MIPFARLFGRLRPHRVPLPEPSAGAAAKPAPDAAERPEAGPSHGPVSGVTLRCGCGVEWDAANGSECWFCGGAVAQASWEET